MQRHWLRLLATKYRRTLWQACQFLICSYHGIPISYTILDRPHAPKYVRPIAWYVINNICAALLFDKYTLLVNIALCRLWDRASNATKPTRNGIDTSIALLVFAGVVFRAEVALLLAPVVLQALWCRYARLTRVIKVGLLSALISIGMFKYISLPCGPI